MSVLCSVSFLGICLGPIQVLIPDGSLRAQAEDLSQANLLKENEGTVNPSETVKVTIVNTTSLDLFAGISGGSRVELTPQGTTTLQFDATPINVFVYPTGPQATLQFATSVVNNVVTVQVTQIPGDTPGDGAININPLGEVDVY
jgi:hypothetical protein